MKGANMESLCDALPKEMAMVRTILGYYRELGHPGFFAAMMIEHALNRADRVIISGDLTEMIGAYKELKEIN
jgi:hypothetical protein